MGIRRTRKDLILADQRQSRKDNGMRKEKERNRRHKRLINLVKGAKPPYTPTVLSWLAEAMGKPGTQITQADVDKLLAAK
jgi:hypothetical protein